MSTSGGQPAPGKQDDVEVTEVSSGRGLWMPTPDERVTVEYPQRTPSDTFPPVRVGECVGSFDDHFTYACAMTGQVLCVSLRDHIPAGVTWRRWVPKDGWPRPRRRR